MGLESWPEHKESMRYKPAAPTASIQVPNVCTLKILQSMRYSQMEMYIVYFLYIQLFLLI